MPAPRPPEFRRRAVELARLREKPIAQIAKDLQISESCLRRWMDVADVDEGHKPGLSSDERKELVELRRKNRVLETEIEILNAPRPISRGRTSSQNRVPAGPGARRRRLRRRGDLPGSEGLTLWLLRVALTPGLGARRR